VHLKVCVGSVRIPRSNATYTNNMILVHHGSGAVDVEVSQLVNQWGSVNKKMPHACKLGSTCMGQTKRGQPSFKYCTVFKYCAVP